MVSFVQLSLLNNNLLSLFYKLNNIYIYILLKMSNYYKILFDNSHITNQSIINLIVVLLVLYIIIFHVLTYILPTFGKPLENCILKCKKDICINITKASKGLKYNYFNKPTYDCIFNGWELSHFIMHIFIGYYFNILYSLSIGLPFEYLEYKWFNCESYIDIFYNTFGALIGSYLRFKIL